MKPDFLAMKPNQLNQIDLQSGSFTLAYLGLPQTSKMSHLQSSPSQMFAGVLTTPLLYFNLQSSEIEMLYPFTL